jgi:uncharacterized protein
MTDAAVAPTGRQERISELDIIRGFALFGVLWMNVLTHADLAIPDAHLATLATAQVDVVVSFLSRWLAAGKAQALFSMLFGFGFAIFMDRVEARGADARAIYLRRMGVLFAIGLAHLFLLWSGDILHSYALAGFLLMLTRRWSDRTLLVVGVVLAVFCVPGILLFEAIAYEGVPPFVAEQAAGQLRRWPLLQAADYPAFVIENARTVWGEVYGYPTVPLFFGFILGRFMIGAWIYRRGWLQDSAQHGRAIRRWAAILIAAGLVATGSRPFLALAGVAAPEPLPILLSALTWAGIAALALGYAAAILSLCRQEAWRRRLSGLGAAGQMALTNYVSQSVVYMFVLYGFGLGLLPYCGATFALAFSLVLFALQVAFSRWWLGRYRFGPLEWVWRSLTYGERQPMRSRAAEPAGLAAG